MKYPKELLPVSTETFALDRGVVVQIPKATPMFQPWNGDSPGDSYGGKAILSYKEQPAFAELVILRIFLDAGWEGVWIDTYRKRFSASFGRHRNRPFFIESTLVS